MPTTYDTIGVDYAKIAFLTQQIVLFQAVP